MGRLHSNASDAELPIEGDVVADLDGNAEDISISSDGEVEESDAVEEEQPIADSYHCFTGHSQSVFSVAWNPVDLYCVASGGQDDLAFLWKTCHPDGGDDELQCYKLEGHSDSVISVEFNHDGTLLASAGMDGSVKIWSMEGTLERTLEGPADAINWMCWHPAGNVILAGAADFSTWMWNGQTGNCMQVFTGHGGSVMCGMFTPDGRSAVTAGDDDDPSLKTWNPRTGDCLATITGHGFHEASINSIDITSDGHIAATASADCTARLSNLTTGQPTATLRGHEDSVESVHFKSGVLPLILTAGLDGKAIVWDQTSLARRQLCTHPAGVVCLCDIRDSPLFATGCMDGMVRLWDARLGSLIRELHGSSDAVQCLAVSQDHQMILSGCDDSTVHVFDVRM